MPPATVYTVCWHTSPSSPGPPKSHLQSWVDSWRSPRQTQFQTHSPQTGATPTFSEAGSMSSPAHPCPQQCPPHSEFLPTGKSLWGGWTFPQLLLPQLWWFWSASPPLPFECRVQPQCQSRSKYWPRDCTLRSLFQFPILSWTLKLQCLQNSEYTPIHCQGLSQCGLHSQFPQLQTS